MKFWDFFLFNVFRDTQRESDRQEQKRRQFYTERMRTAGASMGKFGQAVLDIGEKAYHDDSIPSAITEGLGPALMFAAATVCRADGFITEEQKQVVQFFINKFPHNVSMENVQAAIRSSSPLEQFFPEGYLSADGCGSFWQAVYRACKKTTSPQAELQEAMKQYSTFLAHFSLAGRTESKSQGVCEQIILYAYQHMDDSKSNEVPDFDMFGDGKPDAHMEKFQKIYLDALSKSNVRAELECVDQLLPLFKAKTIADVVMMGDIPASDKIAETELYFAQYGIKLDVDAKAFLLSISKQDDYGQFVSKTIDVVNGEAPHFWQVCHIMCTKAGEDTKLIDLTKEYFGFVMSLAAQLHQKYPNGNYTQGKARTYATALVDSLATMVK